MSSGQIEDAIKFYTEGIALAPDSELLYSNRSAAYCKLAQYNEALKDAEEVIRIKPDWAKVNLDLNSLLVNYLNYCFNLNISPKIISLSITDYPVCIICGSSMIF